MAHIDLYKLGINPEFRKITEVAILRVAIAVAGEDPSNPSDPANPLTSAQVAKRHVLAQKVFNDIKGQAKEFASTIAAEGLVLCTVNEDGSLNYTGGATLSNDIEYRAKAIWDDKAGVSYADLNS